ncbi:MAG: threonine synthase [Evtepia sp.]
MYYVSTRDHKRNLTATEAITQGLARDGGLLTPAYIPKLPADSLESLKTMSYQQRAVYIMSLFLSGYSTAELVGFSDKAYSPTKFDHDKIAPLSALDDATYCLELWHGPTAAFKDMALQMLPHLLTAALTKNVEKKDVCILVATSGDTGKAALEGFRDVKGTKIIVFYPKDGVSEIQALQMKTQEGQNVGVCAVKGNFDDAQSGVKTLFSDEELRARLERKDVFLSSANSINWGRVLPQIVYYISAYCDLLNAEKITVGDPINFCVPTGNFGNILAAFYAKRMGLPIGKLICASNRNNVLTDFIQTGIYDRNRTFYNTMSPSMDILVSSNLERLLFTLSDGDSELISTYMDQLNKGGRYEISGLLKNKIQKDFYSGSCDDEQTQKVIAKVWEKYHYLIDPHTAVAFDVMEQYRAATEDLTTTVVVSTASPFKFCDHVLTALGETNLSTGTDLLDQLAQVTGLTPPVPLAALAKKQIRFEQCVEKTEMMDVVLALN